MKRARHSRMKNTARYVRVDDYTWIEKKYDESDDDARQRFLMKLERFFEGPKLRPAH